MNDILIIASAVVAYAAILLIGLRRRLWSRLGITLYGPVMMIRTRRGHGFIERISSRRHTWEIYGRASIYITLMSMLALSMFLAWRIYRTLTEPITIESPLSLDIKLPGANSIVTVVYALVGFAVAIAVHELTHGIVSVAQRIKLESLGLLLLIVPIGAFAEPNEDELKKTTRSKRAAIYSSGPAINIIVAAIALLLLLGVLGPYAEPTTDGALVTHIVPDSPAEKFGLRTWSQITAVNGHPISDQAEVDDMIYPDPGSLLQVDFVHGSSHALSLMPSGIVVNEVSDGPAFNAGIKPGMIIVSLNDTVINSHAELTSVTENSTHRAPVNITVMRHGYDKLMGRDWFIVDPEIRTINLTSKWAYYYIHYPDSNREGFLNKSAMGVGVSPMGVEVKDPKSLLDTIFRPFKGVHNGGDALTATVRYISLPFTGYAPVASEATDLYSPAGNLNGVPHSLYWTSVNFVYWIFWTNLLLGLTNALPALPMDGGNVLKDVFRELFHRWGLRLTGLDRTIGRAEPTDLQADMLVYLVSASVYGATLFLLVWQVLGL